MGLAKIGFKVGVRVPPPAR